MHTQAAPHLASADLSRVAVIAVDTTDHQRYRSAVTKDGTLTDVEKRFAQALTAKGYTVSSGPADTTAKAQIDFDKSLDQSGVVQLGRAANAPAVLLVRITQYSRSEQQAESPAPPPPWAINGPANRPSPDKTPNRLPSQKQYQVTAAITARLVSVPAGEVLWTGWQSRSADRLEGEDDGGVLNQTCDDIAQALPVLPTPQHPATSPATRP